MKTLKEIDVPFEEDEIVMDAEVEVGFTITNPEDPDRVVLELTPKIP
jgi:hypothetical protein